VPDHEGRLARHVAEAADAWLRDPLDAAVYRRLVDATLAWRDGRDGPDGRTRPGPTEDEALGRARASRAVPGSDPAADGGAVPEDDDARYLRPERAPRAVGSTLADVASMLRARGAAARSEGTADPPHEPGER